MNNNFNSFVQTCDSSLIIHEVKMLSFNSYKFERGSIITHNRALYKIEMILSIESDFTFLASVVNCTGIHDDSQSILITTDSQYKHSIKFSDILHKKPYSTKFIQDKEFAIIDNYDILQLIL